MVDLYTPTPILNYPFPRQDVTICGGLLTASHNNTPSRSILQLAVSLYTYSKQEERVLPWPERVCLGLFARR